MALRLWTCYRNKFSGIEWQFSELASGIKRLLNERTEPERSDSMESRQEGDSEEFLSKKEFCQSLEKRRLLDLLSSGEPEQIGFTFDWYRHSI
ncbi:hypothetical protein N7517_009529 [Penicillium concentricum]|uniref:Uncharacterized protein n=1 Tax=Penicillium concentricum TaxID=293559 RepID=A0A9W9UWQ1_9EURO|nr:uncharacterized protein N7517_009529 [Penicillium concentricum]KAJ5360338.1 hypothetical protein N7517_009529 [Penicillium concentricum]